MNELKKSGNKRKIGRWKEQRETLRNNVSKQKKNYLSSKGKAKCQKQETIFKNITALVCLFNIVNQCLYSCVCAVCVRVCVCVCVLCLFWCVFIG